MANCHKRPREPSIHRAVVSPGTTIVKVRGRVRVGRMPWSDVAPEVLYDDSSGHVRAANGAHVLCERQCDTTREGSPFVPLVLVARICTCGFR